MKNSIRIYSEKLIGIFNESLINEKFPDTLKRADFTPIFKNKNGNEKESYRPVSMLSTFPNVLGKLLFEQINDHMQSIFSKLLTQNALLVMIERWNIILNKKLKVDTLFMGLIKMFDTLDHYLLLAKIKCVWFW